MPVDPSNYVGGIWLPEVLALFGGSCMGGDNFGILTTNSIILHHRFGEPNNRKWVQRV